jgi:hypothetical protein
MKIQLTIPRMLALAVVPFTLGLAPLAGWANDEFDEAHVFFELNNTDGDLGIHALIDGDAWRKLRISDPKGKGMLDIKVKSRLKQQGLTEIFFESAEPPFESDDPEGVTLIPEEFFERFPEGDYSIRGKTLEHDTLISETGVTHVMPGPPVVMVNTMAAAEDCDADLPVVSTGDPVTIHWEAVTHSHPDLGTSGVMIDVVNYEVVVEIDETPFKTSTILPPSANSFEVPPEILALGDEVKFEVLVREASYNQTAVESCFCIDACPED